MVPEPRKPFDYGVSIYPHHWYCLHCNQWRTTSGTLNVHLDSTHGIKGAERVQGVDFAMGDQIIDKVERRLLWEAKQPDIFARQLDSLLGAEDFVYEVGSGSAVEKGNWHAK